MIFDVIVRAALFGLFRGGMLKLSAARFEMDQGEQALKFNSTFLMLVLENCTKPGSEEERVLRHIIEHRRKHCLDSEAVTPDPLRYGKETWDREIKKLLTIFENIRTVEPPNERPFMVEALKEKYSADEVDEIVQEYFPNLLEQGV
jgi:hypothetical protein